MTGNAGTINLSSSAALNQPFGPWITINHAPGYACTRQHTSPTRWLQMFSSVPVGTTAGTEISVDGQVFRIFIPPGQLNIGYIARWKLSVASNIWNATQPSYGTLRTLLRSLASGGISRGAWQGPIPTQYNVSTEVQVRLVKTSAAFPSNGDSVSFDALLTDLYISTGPTVGPQFPPANNPAYTTGVNATFQVFTPTCSTPSLADSGNTVPLGGVYSTALTGPGSAGSAAPSVPFTLRVNCSAGFEQGVKYRFLACPSCTTPPQNSTLTLDGSATAGGVGVQVLHDDDSTLLTFNSDHNLSDYNNASGGQYDIPLRARIIQTCPTTNCVSPGSVRASMIMQMVYP